MIKLLIITFGILFFIWLLSELFVKKKKKIQNVPKFKNLLLLLTLMIILLITVFILPRLGISIFSLLQKFLLPIAGIIRNFIPF